MSRKDKRKQVAEILEKYSNQSNLPKIDTHVATVPDRYKAENRYGQGNIDLTNRPVVKNSNGSISTVRSISFYDDKEKKEILVPTVVNGKVVSNDEAIDNYYKTGQFLGKFNTVDEANAYAEKLHQDQDKMYRQPEQQMSTWDKVKKNAGFIAKYTGNEAVGAVENQLQGYGYDAQNYSRSKGNQSLIAAAADAARNVGSFATGLGTINSVIDSIPRQFKILKDTLGSDKKAGEKIIDYISASMTNTKTTMPLFSQMMEMSNLGTEATETITGKDKEDIINAQTAATREISRNYENRRDSYEQDESVGNGVKTAARVFGQVGRMLPTIATSAATGEPDMGLFYTMGQSVMGSTVNERLDKGESLEEATNRGNLEGAKEVATEKMFGGIHALGGGALDKFTTGISSKVTKVLGKKLTGLIGDALGESVEEIVGDVGEYIINIAKGEDTDLSWSNEWETTWQTWATTLILNALTDGMVGLNTAGSKAVVNKSNLDATTKANLEEFVKDKQITKQGASALVNGIADIEDKAEVNKLLKSGELQDVVEYVNTAAAEGRSNIINNAEISDEEKAALTRVAEKGRYTGEQIRKVLDNKAELEDTTKRLQTFNESASKYNLDTENPGIKAVFDLTNRRGVQARFDADHNWGKGENAMWIPGENGSREIVINPNAESNKTLENLAVHEITHDMEGTKEYKQLADLLLKGSKVVEGRGIAYDSIYKSYKDFYEKKGIKKTAAELKEIADSEFVANAMGDAMGNQEFIDYLMENTEKSTIQKIIDAIGNVINKLTGYKDQQRYWKEVQEKYKKAFDTKYQPKNKDISYSIDNNKNAKFTEERLNDIIDDSVTKWTPGYANNYVTRMTPQQFLDLTTTPEIMERLKSESRELNEEDLRGERQNIFLKVDMETGRVVGHEGRHRMIALQNAGVENVDIVIHPVEGTYNKDNAEDFNYGLYLIGQRLGDGIKGKNVNAKNPMIAVNYKNIDKIKSEFLSNANESDVRYSIDSTDSQGRKLTKEQQEFFKDSSKEILTKSGKIQRWYHTMSNAGKAFNEFNPVGTPGYKFGNQVVNFVTNNKTMSESYADDMSEKPTRYNINGNEGKHKYIYEGYLNVKNPFVVDSNNRNYGQANIRLNEQQEEAIKTISNMSENEIAEAKKLQEQALNEFIQGDERTEALREIRNELKGNGYEEERLAIDVGNAMKFVEEAEQNGTKTGEALEKFREANTNYAKSLIKEANPNYDDYLVDVTFDNLLYDYNNKTLDFRNSSIGDKLGIDKELTLREIDTLLNEKNPNAVTDVLGRFKELLDASNLSDDIKKLANMEVNNFENLNQDSKYYKTGISNLYSALVYKDIRDSFNINNLKESIGGNKIVETTNDVIKRVLQMNKEGANYDAVIFKNLYDYGGATTGENRGSGDVVAFFNSNQFKDINNLKPTDNPDIRHSIEIDGNEYEVEGDEVSPYQRSIKKDWNIDSIQQQLKKEQSSSANVKDEMDKFDSYDELKENIFYHGSTNFNRNLKAGSTLREDQRTGGYGEAYHTISLSKSRNLASNFASMGATGVVTPVLLRKGARVIEMDDVSDSIELEDYLPELWNNNIDAVKLGEGSEEEIVILNPKAIVVMDKGRTDFRNYGKPRFENLNDEELETLYQEYNGNKDGRSVRDIGTENTTLDISQIRTDKDLHEYEKSLENEYNSRYGDGALEISITGLPGQFAVAVKNKLNNSTEREWVKTSNPQEFYGQIKPLLNNMIEKVGFKAETTNNNTNEGTTTDNKNNKVNPNMENFMKSSYAREDDSLDGRIKELYHGTNSGEFFTFDRTKGSSEGDWGAGFYLTDSEADVEANYEGGGPDFENKVSRLAERLEEEKNISYEEAKEIARERLESGSYRITAYANITNPVIVGKTNLFDTEYYMDDIESELQDEAESYQEEIEEYAKDYFGVDSIDELEESDLKEARDEYLRENGIYDDIVQRYFEDDIDKAVYEVSNNLETYQEDELRQILWEAVYEGGIEVEELKNKINDQLEITDDEGNLANNEAVRLILESLGYDGIIDHTVSDKFSNMNMPKDTTHYIVFNSNQIKDINNQNPTENPDIRYSINTDSQGRELTKEQQNFLINSKAVDNNGHPIKLYHGTNQAGFTKVNNYLFLTPNREIAQDYAGGDKTYDPNNPNSDLTPIQTNGKNSYFKNVEEIRNNINEYTLGDLQAIWNFIDENNGFSDTIYDYDLEGQLNTKIKDIDSSAVRDIVDATLEELNNWNNDDQIPIPSLSNEQGNNSNLYTENRKIYETYANIENPLEMDLQGGKVTTEMINRAKQEGYDGIIAHNTGEGRGNKKGDTYIVFKSNQLIDANNDNVRYSINIDSEGKELSKQQKEYFKDSKVRDDDGKLLVVYHGTNEDFNVFKANRFVEEENGLTQIKGYFSTDPSYSEVYGKVTPYYLNLKNPLEFKFENGYELGTLEEWKKLFESKGIKGVKFDSSLYEPNDKGDTNNNGDKVYGSYEIVDATAYWAGDGNLTEKIKEAGYDGIIWTEGFGEDTKAYMPFEENAIKRVDNKNPTSNPDIRYSQETQSVWDEFINRWHKNTGTQTKLQDAKLPQKPITMADFEKIIDSKVNIPPEEKKAEKARLKDIKLTPESLQEYDDYMTLLDRSYSVDINNVEQNQEEEVPKLKKTLNPTQISNLKPEDASTTPKLPDKRIAKGDKASEFVNNINNKVGFLDEETKKVLTSDENVQFYKSITNAQTLSKAYKDLSEGGNKATYDWYAKESSRATPEDVAKGWILFKQYADNKDTENLVRVARKMRDMGTKSAQTLQAFNILARLTPEGMASYAQMELQEAYENMIKGKSKTWIDAHKGDFELSQNEIAQIMDIMTNLPAENPETNNYERKVALGQVQKIISEKIPNENGKIKAWMRISMLFNPKTQVRNVVGNAGVVPVNMFSDFLGSKIDKMIAKQTGIRTLGTMNKNYIKGMKEGFYQSYNDFRLGINTRDVEGNKFELGTGKTWKDKGIGKALNRTESILNFVMDFGDRGFSQAAFVNSLNNQMLLNGVTKPTQEMIDIAQQEALSRTWNDNNEYTKFVLGIRAGLNKIGTKNYGLGDVLIPFAKTPANLTKAIVDYSPVGFTKQLFKIPGIKNAIETGQLTAQQQHDFVDLLGKGMAGSLLYVAGYALAAAGVASGAGDDDKDVRNFMRYSLGIQPYSIKVGNKSFTYDWSQPIATPLAIMSNLYKQNKENPDATWWEKAMNAANIGTNQLLEQSFMESLNEVLNGNGEITERIQKAIFDLPARAIPTFAKQIADMVDSTQRTSFEYGQPGQTAKQSAIAKLPGLSKDLTPSVDTLGNDIEKYGGENNFFNVFFNPANMNKGKKTEAAQEIYDVYEATGDTSVFPVTAPYYVNYDGEKITMSSKERAEYQRTAGKYTEKAVNQLINDSNYQSLSDDDKAEILSKVVTDSNEKAKKDILNITKSSSDLDLIEEIGSNYYTYKSSEKAATDAKRAETGNSNASLSDTEKINVLRNKNYTDQEKESIYTKEIKNEDDEVYNSLKAINNGSSRYIDAYLDYKSTKFESDREDDGTLKGKAISGSKKEKVEAYLKQSNFDSFTKLYLYGTQYKLDSAQRQQFERALNQKALTPSQKKEIYLTMNGVTEMKNGSITWK